VIAIERGQAVRQLFRQSLQIDTSTEIKHHQAVRQLFR
jgi:hypothetical protein